jgi:hypothetical protein
MSSQLRAEFLQPTDQAPQSTSLIDLAKIRQDLPPGQKMICLHPEDCEPKGNEGLPKLTIEDLSKGKPTEAEIKQAVRELNHETYGMVEPGKESVALRQANESLLHGDAKKFAEAFKGLSPEQRKNVVESMNQAFEKRGANTRLAVDGDGNIIVSNTKPGEETVATKINPDTGNVTEITGKRDGNDFIVSGQSTSTKGETIFKEIGEKAAGELLPSNLLQPLKEPEERVKPWILKLNQLERGYQLKTLPYTIPRSELERITD